MSDDLPNTSPAPASDDMVRDLLAIQQQELLLRREEQNVRIEEIRSNEKIALASIAAQEKTDIARNQVFSAMLSKRFWIWIVAIAALATVIALSMIHNQTAIAMKIIEIGGAVALGYFAGVNRGKMQEMENRQHRQD